MDIKTKIKNDLWRWNYIVPFAKKYLYGNGKTEIVKHVLRTYRQIKPVKTTEKPRTVGKDVRALLEGIDVVLPADESRFVYFIDTKKTIAVQGNILSNFPMDYDKIVNRAFSDLAGEAVGSDPYGREAANVVKGIEDLVDRILDAVKRSDLKIRERLIHDFSRILDAPAEHVDEALQRILFFNQIMWQTRHRLNGLGRLDHILRDLYDSDISTDYMTREGVAEAIKDFLDRLSLYSEYKSDALQGDIGQIIILGGLNQDGSYFSNDLTEIFLTEQAALKKPDPKTLLRVSKDMPEKLLKTAVECLTAKTGSPLFSNDDVVIPALLDFGISVEDACNYCVSACWEPFIAGKSMDQNNIAVFDFFPALDTVLNELEKQGNDLSDFEELVTRYMDQNRENFQKLLDRLDRIKWAKDPLVSILTDGCNGARTDVSDGGAVYSNYGITTVALSNVVDSLLNIKKFVFDLKKYSIAELNHIRIADFKGQNKLYSQVNSNKYYGHDREDSVTLAMRISDSLVDIVKVYRNPLGGTVKFGLSSPGYNMVSRNTPADLSGKKKGMPYNTHISCMNAGYTEVVNFAGRLNYKEQRFNGNVVDFFTPAHMIGDNIEKFVLFLRGAIKAGFFQMQMNLMDSRTLIDAKAHPENYTGLIVRVWGFSAYFNDLPESYQDLLIERAKAAEQVA